MESPRAHSGQAFLYRMPHYPAVVYEHLAQLRYLSVADIAREIDCTPNHINVLLPAWSRLLVSWRRARACVNSYTK